MVDAHVSRFAYNDDFIVGLKVKTDSDSYDAEGAGMPGAANGFFIVPKIERVGQLGMEEREFLAACKEQDVQICNEVLADQPPPYSIQALINWFKKIFQGI